MPNTSRAAIVRSQIKTILSGVSPLSANSIKLGIIDEKPNDEFFQDLADNGYFVKIGPAVQTHYSQAENYSEFKIEIVLYFPIPVKADFDFLAVEDLVFHDVRNALGLSTNYPNSAPAKDIEVEGPELMLDLAFPAGLFRFKTEFYGD